MGNAHPTKAESRFLSLPLELRLEIYGYIIPKSVKQPPGRGIDHVWHRGNIAILAVNKQIHDEVAQMIYGDPTFNLRVEKGRVSFQYHYPTPCSGIYTHDSVTVAGGFSKYIRYMRNLRVQLIPTFKSNWDFQRIPSEYRPPNVSKSPIVRDWPRPRILTTHDGAQMMVEAMDSNMDMLLAKLIKALRIQNLNVNVELEHLGRCDVEFDRLYLTPLLHLGNVSKLTFGGGVSRDFQDEASKLFENRENGSPEEPMSGKSHSSLVKRWKADNLNDAIHHARVRNLIVHRPTATLEAGSPITSRLSKVENFPTSHFKTR